MSCLEKIKTIEEVVSVLESEQAKNKSVVHAHGCFDLLHYVMINDQDVDSKDRQNAKQNEKENKSGGNIEFSISASDGQ